jgi:hypothetical protein
MYEIAVNQKNNIDIKDDDVDDKGYRFLDTCRNMIIHYIK